MLHCDPRAPHPVDHRNIIDELNPAFQQNARRRLRPSQQEPSACILMQGMTAAAEITLRRWCALQSFAHLSSLVI